MAPIPLPAAPGRGVLWYERFRGAAAAAILLLALFKVPQLFLATSPSSGPDGAVASGPLAGAYSTFNLLVASLQNGAAHDVLMGEARNLSRRELPRSRPGPMSATSMLRSPHRRPPC